MPDRDKALFGFLAPGGQVLAGAFRDHPKAIVSQLSLATAFSSEASGDLFSPKLLNQCRWNEHTQVVDAIRASLQVI